MRISICDDDPILCQDLSGLLKTYFSSRSLPLPEIQVFESSDALLADPGPWDLLFLDMEMPGTSGVDAGPLMKERNPSCIIFVVTSYPDYLDDALRFHAFRYLSKPVDPKRLFRNLDDAMNLYTSQHQDLTVETAEGVFRIRLQELVMIESAGRGTFLHLENGQELFCKTSVEQWEERLPEEAFFRTSRSHIVNLRHVYAISDGTVFMRQENCRAECSRRRTADAKKALLYYKASARS